MMFKIIGAVLVLVGCGGFGFYTAHIYRRQVLSLTQLIRVLEFMECELEYRQTPLPELIRKSADICSGKLAELLCDFARELEGQIYPDAASCMALVLRRIKDFPSESFDALVQLGRTLGCFDADGQCKGIRAVRAVCEQNLKAYTVSQDARLRTYRTLGICAGAAMVILFI